MRALLLCALLVAAVYAADWLEVDRAAPYETVNLRFALRQRNLDVLESTLLDTSDPASPNYAKWWTTSEILDLVAPDASVSDFVVNFLLQNGAMNVENRRDMIKCEMAVREVESLLRTTMHVYEAGNSQIIRTRDGYTMPSEISEYVDFISGMEEFPQVREDKRRPIKTGVDIPAQGYVIPEHIQSLYKIPSTYPNNAKTSIALVEFEDDTSYSPTDLKNFEQQMAIPEINVDHTVGPFNGSSPDAESSLDVQYGGAIAINSSVWFWTVDGWMYEFATDIQNATEAPLVVSMSWGWPEPLQCQIDPDGCGTESSFNYVDRLNVEFQKIGLSGITLVAASGDQGAPGDGNADCSNTTVPLWTIFPGASPWVLSVGATMLEGLFVEDEAPAANPPICSQVKCATSTKEGVCTYPDALITTGGGFSNVSPRPSYQNTVVSSYLSSGVTLPDNTFFNKSNRGFPDVSALGHNYLIAWNGQFQQVDGTSCSTPVLAGMITLLNSQRLNSGKQPLGFVVPLMYSAYASNSAIFNDITKGDNKCTEYCCAKTGYEATKGWDPVTGLGTPNFDLLSNYVKTLPN